MKALGYFAVVVGLIVFVGWAYISRYTTNTAGGRFYKNDRWTGETIVVEKDGTSHFLVKPSK